MEPVQDEECYAEAAPFVVEWPQARAAFLSKGARRVERARAGVRRCETELVLIGDHELTLPSVDTPVGRGPPPRRTAPGKVSLIAARWEVVQALYWRWVRLVLTLGRWRR